MRHLSVLTQMAEMRARTKKGNVQSAPEDEEDNLVETMDAKFNHTGLPSHFNCSSDGILIGGILGFGIFSGTPQMGGTYGFSDHIGTGGGI